MPGNFFGGLEVDYAHFEDQDEENSSWKFVPTRLRLGKKDFRCSFCKSVVVDPMRTGCCKALHCKECYELDELPEKRYKEKACKLCRAQLRDDGKGKWNPPLHPIPIRCSKYFLKCLESLEFKCDYEECGKTYKYTQFEDHYQRECTGVVRCSYCRSKCPISSDFCCAEWIREKIENAKIDMEVQKVDHEKANKDAERCLADNAWR